MTDQLLDRQIAQDGILLWLPRTDPYDPQQANVLDAARSLLPWVGITDRSFPDALILVRVDFDGAAVSFMVLPAVEHARLTARTLRSLPLYSYAKRAHELWVARVGADEPGTSHTEHRIVLDRIDLKKPGRRGRGDVEYARVAARYKIRRTRDGIS